MEPRATAFVLMPFGAAFDPVYTMFIRPALEQAGYAVKRADDIRSQRSILHDIVESIETSDLILADLTESNANVFYELGLAHALDKPVILITQSIEDVPFDLQSYRLLTYSTHFAEVDKARHLLIEYANGRTDGTIRFSSPVTDYRSGSSASFDAAQLALPSDDRGLLDHMEAIENGYGRLTEIMEAVGTLASNVTAETQSAVADFERSKQSRQKVPYGHLRRIANQLSDHLNEFAVELRKLNEEYTAIAAETDSSVEFIVGYPGAADQESLAAFKDFLATLELVHDQASTAVLAYRNLSNTMTATPPFEKSMIRAQREAAAEVGRMADNMELTVASITRGLEAGRRRLSVEIIDTGTGLSQPTANGA